VEAMLSGSNRKHIPCRRELHWRMNELSEDGSQDILILGGEGHDQSVVE